MTPARGIEATAHPGTLPVSVEPRQEFQKRQAKNGEVIALDPREEPGAFLLELVGAHRVADALPVPRHIVVKVGVGTRRASSAGPRPTCRQTGRASSINHCRRIAADAAGRCSDASCARASSGLTGLRQEPTVDLQHLIAPDHQRVRPPLGDPSRLQFRPAHRRRRAAARPRRQAHPSRSPRRRVARRPPRERPRSRSSRRRISEPEARMKGAVHVGESVSCPGVSCGRRGCQSTAPGDVASGPPTCQERCAGLSTWGPRRERRCW